MAAKRNEEGAHMKAAIFEAKGKITIADVPEPVIQNGDEAIVRVTHSCICGSDLWFYRGQSPQGERIGHEFMGVVEAVGDDVKTIKVGDFVIAPFVISDGTCPECKVGETRFCRHGMFWGTNGYDAGQGEKVRLPFADGTLVVVPGGNDLDEHMLRALLPLTDVLSTGHHAALDGRVGTGSTVAVIGDGAVGLCAVAASKRLGASRIFLVSTHADRAKIGAQFGATDIIDARGEDAVKQIKEATDDLGVDSALECVGTPEAWDTAFDSVRIGGDIGFVGVPHDVADIPVSKLFGSNKGIKGSGASARHHIPELMVDVLNGSLDVSAIFTEELSLDDIAKGYQDMDERRAVKVLIRP
jgi:threonine dehydrogenase-like Zn-dependent dehydrogenase